MRKYVLLFIVLLLSVTINAQDSFDINIASTRPILNEFKISYVDPASPQAQPYLFYMDIEVPAYNEENFMDAPYHLNLSFWWNDHEIFDTKLVPINAALSPSNSFRVFNKDLITSVGSTFFEFAPGEDISLEEIINNSPELEDFVLETGRFPDGTYRFDVELVANIENLSNKSSSTSFLVQSIQNVHLINPGIGNTSYDIPIVTEPITFNWNSAGIDNKYQIEIREYDELYEFQNDNAEINGRIVVKDNIEKIRFYQADYNFKDEKYYGWRINVSFTDEMSLNLDSDKQALHSEFKFFQYKSSQGNPVSNVFIDDFLEALKQLDNDEINAILKSGYLPKGGLELNGQYYYGKQALDLIKDLKDIDILDTSIE